jgi:hypothetical protein
MGCGVARGRGRDPGRMPLEQQTQDEGQRGRQLSAIGGLVSDHACSDEPARAVAQDDTRLVSRSSRDRSNQQPPLGCHREGIVTEPLLQGVPDLLLRRTVRGGQDCLGPRSSPADPASCRSGPAAAADRQYEDRPIPHARRPQQWNVCHPHTPKQATATRTFQLPKVKGQGVLVACIRFGHSRPCTVLRVGRGLTFSRGGRGWTDHRPVAWLSRPFCRSNVLDPDPGHGRRASRSRHRTPLSAMVYSGAARGLVEPRVRATQRLSSQRARAWDTRPRSLFAKRPQRRVCELRCRGVAFLSLPSP